MKLLEELLWACIGFCDVYQPRLYRHVLLVYYLLP